MIDLLMETAGWTLLHFLWQGAVIGALLGLLLVLLRKSPQVRYLAGCVALLAMVGAAAGTFTVQYRAATERKDLETVPTPEVEATWTPALAFSRCRPCHLLPAQDPTDPSLTPTPLAEMSCRVGANPEGIPLPQSFAPFAAAEFCPEESEETESEVTAAGSSDDDERAGPPALSWLVTLWLAGVVLLSLRFALAWGCAHRLRQRCTLPVDDSLARSLRRIAARIGVARPVRILRSAAVTVPTVVGWLRPLILLPAASVAGLSRSQLEAVLAHELAHIRRHDYLVNLFQHVVETILFFHPAVWWVSHKMREEREHCCDDIAAQSAGGVLDYARALATLEEQRDEGLALGMAVNGGSLLARIRRLCGVERQPGLPMIALPALVLVAALIVPLSLVDAQQPADPKRDAEAPAKPPAPRTLTSAEGMKGLRHLLTKEPEAGIPFDDFVLLSRPLDDKAIATLLDEIGMQRSDGYRAWTRSALYAEWARRDLDAALDYFRKNFRNHRGIRGQVPHALFVGSRPKDPWKALEYLHGLPDDPRFRFDFELNRQKAPMIYRSADWYKESYKRLFQELAVLDPERAWRELPGRGEDDDERPNQNKLISTNYPYVAMVDGFFSGLKDRETIVRFVERFGPVGEPGTESVAIVIAKAWMRFDLAAAQDWAPPQEPIYSPLGVATLIWGVDGNAARAWARENPEAALRAIRNDTLPNWSALMAESLLEGNPHLASELVTVLGKAHKPVPMPEIIFQIDPDDRPINITPPVSVPTKDVPPTAWKAIRDSLRENVKVDELDAFPEPGRQNRSPDFRARYQSYRKAIASEVFTQEQQADLRRLLDAAFEKVINLENAN